jgi:hypothetical protein
MIKTIWPTQIQVTKFPLDIKQKFPEDWEIQWRRGTFLPELQAEVNSKVNEYWETCGFKNIPLSEIMVWYNYLDQPGSHIRPHTHGVALVGWCYYIATPPGSGALAFFNPAGSTSWDLLYHPEQPGRSPHYEYLWRHEPEEGDLIIFPSWLSHYVEPTNSDQPRISVAGEYHLANLIKKI